MANFDINRASHDDLVNKRSEYIELYKKATVRACHIYDYWNRYKKAEDFEQDSIQEHLLALSDDARRAIKEAANYIKFLRKNIDAINHRLMDLAKDKND